MAKNAKNASNEPIRLTKDEAIFNQNATNAGYAIEWIPRGKMVEGVGQLPTNDFVWDNLEWEMKTPSGKLVWIACQ